MQQLRKMVWPWTLHIWYQQYQHSRANQGCKGYTRCHPRTCNHEVHKNRNSGLRQTKLSNQYFHPIWSILNTFLWMVPVPPLSFWTVFSRWIPILVMVSVKSDWFFLIEFFTMRKVGRKPWKVVSRHTQPCSQHGDALTLPSRPEILNTTTQLPSLACKMVYASPPPSSAQALSPPIYLSMDIRLFLILNYCKQVI